MLKGIWKGLLGVAGDTVIDPLEGQRRIGIEEIHYGKGHRYLTVVVDHALLRREGLYTSHIVEWRAPGRLIGSGSTCSGRCRCENGTPPA